MNYYGNMFVHWLSTIIIAEYKYFENEEYERNLEIFCFLSFFFFLLERVNEVQFLKWIALSSAHIDVCVCV